MTAALAWGLIGTGAIAKAFTRAVAASKLGRVVAVGSRTKEAADKFGDEFKVERRHGSYDALLADKGVQAVYISTPHPMHAEWTIKAAEAGKHTLCEKPIGMNAAEAMAMIDAARQHNIFLMEAFMYRCHPQTQKLVELIRGKAIGEVRMIQASFGFHAGYDEKSRLWSNALGGGGILDVGCYAMSISRLVAGAAVGKDFADPIDVKGAGKLAPTGVDEYAAATLTFPGDIVGQVATGVGLGLENVVRIFGTAGNILVPNPWTSNRAGGGEFHIHVNRTGKAGEDVVIKTDVTAFTSESEVVATAVAAGQKQAPPPAMTWDDSLGNMKALDAWKAAAGVVYESESRRGATRTITGRPLKHNAAPDGKKMKYGKVAGVDKPVSRLVMGVDNQRFMPHAAIMFDDYFERGGNCFDCSHWYGEGVQGNLAAWMHHRGVREQVVVLEKGGHTPYCYPKEINRQILESLERYNTPYFDLWMMHRDNLDVPVGEFVDALNEHVKAGRIKAFGGSNWTTARVQEANDYAAKKNLRGFAAVSDNFSLAQMVSPPWPGCVAASDPPSRAWFEKTQTALMPWSSQARGFFLPGVSPDDTSNEELTRCWFSDDNFRRRDRAVELAEKRGVEPINIALAYVLHQPFPTFPLIGPRQLTETRSSFKALEVDLSPQDVKWLNLEA